MSATIIFPVKQQIKNLVPPTPFAEAQQTADIVVADFSYSEILIQAWLRLADGVAIADLDVILNDDVAAVNYAYQFQRASSSNTLSNQVQGYTVATRWILKDLTANTVTAGELAYIEILLNRYNDAVNPKQAYFRSFSNTNVGGFTVLSGWGLGSWKKAERVTKITLSHTVGFKAVSGAYYRADYQRKL